MRAGLQAGLIAASATGGALLAFGMGLDRPWLPFNLASHILLGGRALFAVDMHPLVTPLGVAVHVTAILIWGVMYAWLAAGRPWRVSIPLAFLFGALVFLLNTRIFPSGLRPGYESVLSDAQMIFLHLALATALLIGTRFAFLRRR